MTFKIHRSYYLIHAIYYLISMVHTMDLYNHVYVHFVTFFQDFSYRNSQIISVYLFSYIPLLFLFFVFQFVCRMVYLV